MIIGSWALQAARIENALRRIGFIVI
jgi:hypothetical protein